MPISNEDKREREEARVEIETVREIGERRKLIKVIEDEIAVVKKLGLEQTKEEERIKGLKDQQDKLEKAYVTTTKALKDKLEEMERENTALNRTVETYNKLSQVALTFTKVSDTLLKSHHNYNLEIQKIVDLTGKFTRSTQSGIDAFEKMRTQLKLTRQEGIEFGKVWSEVSRMGIDPAKFTQAAKQLQTVFGQKGGLAAAQQVAQAKVSRPILEAALGGDQVAMAKAMRSAGNLDQAYAITGLAGGPRGALAGRAARFEETAARVTKVKDDIQAGMAAALDLGMGPEIGALALPVAEINKNVARLVQISLLNAGGGFKGIAGMAGASGGGSGLLASIPGLGKWLKGGGLAAAGILGGTALHHYGTMAPEGSAAGTTLTRSGRALQGAGIGAGIGSVVPGLGTGVGAVTGAFLGTTAAIYEENAEVVNKFFHNVIDKGNHWITALIAGEEGIRNLDYQNALLDLENYAKGAAASLENLAGTVAKLPETLESQIAQSRLPHALMSIDPAPMVDLLHKSSQAFTTAMGESTKVWNKDMAGFAKQLEDFEAMGGEKGAEGARNVRTRMAEYQLNMDKQMEAMSMVGVSKGTMQRFETQRGQIGLETQAAQAEYERKFAGTGNIEEMQKIQARVNSAYEATLGELHTTTNLSRDQLTEEMNKWQNEANLVVADEKLRASYQYRADVAKDELMQLERQVSLTQQQLAAENQQFNIQKSLEQAMAATETIMFKRSQRAMALAKAQESFARERGAGPEEIGGYAVRQAGESQRQLSSFMDTFSARMADLQKQLNAPGTTAVQRLALEQKIFDLSDKRVHLEMESLQARIHAATAEERYRQDLIGSSKRISEIQRDTAAKLGLSWRVQMSYQAQIIRASQEDLQSKGREIAQWGDELRKSGEDPRKNVAFMRGVGDLLQKQADLTEAIIGKQRSFLEQSTAASFGVGAGSRISPIVNPRIFGEMIQGATGIRQQGAPMTMQEQQRIRMGGLNPNVFGGIGGGVPGPMGMPGVPPGLRLPPGPGAPGEPGVPQPGNAAMGAQDITGNIQIGLNDQMLEVRVARIVRSMNQPGGNRAMG